MNKFLLDELKKCVVADVIFNEKSGVAIIKKSNRMYTGFRSGIDYILKLDDSLLDKTGSALETNWNNDITPRSKYLIGNLLESNSSLFCFNARGFDFDAAVMLDDFYERLWLPKNKFCAIGELG